MACLEFPMPLVKAAREIKAVNSDNRAIWYRILDGQLQFCPDSEGDIWYSAHELGVVSRSPNELEVIAELKRNPTSIREIK